MSHQSCVLAATRRKKIDLSSSVSRSSQSAAGGGPKLASARRSGREEAFAPAQRAPGPARPRDPLLLRSLPASRCR